MAILPTPGPKWVNAQPDTAFKPENLLKIEHMPTV